MRSLGNKHYKLVSFEAKELKEGQKIVDVTYTITASLDFRNEQKAAYAMQKKRQLYLVDNSKQTLE